MFFLSHSFFFFHLKCVKSRLKKFNFRSNSLDHFSLLYSTNTEERAGLMYKLVATALALKMDQNRFCAVNPMNFLLTSDTFSPHRYWAFHLRSSQWRHRFRVFVHNNTKHSAGITNRWLKWPLHHRLMCVCVCTRSDHMEHVTPRGTLALVSNPSMLSISRSDSFDVNFVVFWLF